MLLMFFSLVSLFHYSLSLFPDRVFWMVGGRRTRQMIRRRRGLFVVLLLVVLPCRLVLPPLMCREDSFAVTNLWPSRHLLFVSLLRSVSFASVNASHKVLPENLLLKPTFHPLQVLLFQFVLGDWTTAGCGTPRMTLRLNLEANSLTRTSSPRVAIITSIPASLCLKSLFCGSGEIRIANGDFDGSGEFTNLTTMQMVLQRVLNKWDWTSKRYDHVSPFFSPPNVKLIDMNCDNLISVAKFLRISGGFTGVFQFQLRRILVGSSGLGSSVLLPSFCFSSLIGLSSCGAVSTGPEDAIEITSVILVDEVWTSTSHCVTILQQSDSVVKAFSTHSSFDSNPLSFSVEELSYVAILCFVCYAYDQRECIISFFLCIQN